MRVLELNMMECLLICLVSTEEVHLTPETSPELTKRSWFGSLMGSERDEAYTILVRGKPLASVKADLIHAFLSVSREKFTFNFIRFLVSESFQNPAQCHSILCSYFEGCGVES